MIISHQSSEAISIDVSVIIPTHNRILMLEEALASVFSQEFDGVFEIIVVDDNSQDGTSEIVATKYPEVYLISLEQNLGHGAARNRAIKLAKGKYIAFLDSDDLWKPDYLKLQIASLKSQERSLAISGLEIWHIPSDRRYCLAQKPDLNKYMSPIHQLLIVSKGFVNTPSSVIFPQYVFDEVGMFEENFRFGVDIDLYLRCLGADFTMTFTESPVAIKRNGIPDQLTNPKNLKAREKSVFARIDKFYDLYGNANITKVPSIKHIYTVNYLAYANVYFKYEDPLNGLNSYRFAACNGSPVEAFSQAVKSVFYYVGRKIKKPIKTLLSRTS